MKKAYRIAPELKEQIINRIKNEGVLVSQAATDHGVAEGIIYRYNHTRIHSALKMPPERLQF